MARSAKNPPLLLIVLMLVCLVALVNCGQGSKGSVSLSPTPTPPPRPTGCTSCITVGEPSLEKLDESTDGVRYRLSFVITNNGESTLSNFEVSLRVEAQTATTQQSDSETSTSSSPISGHGQFTYQFGDPNTADSGITLPNPPPSSVRITVTLMQDTTTLANWDGQINVPV